MNRRGEESVGGPLLRAVLADQVGLRRLIADAVSYQVPSVRVAAVDGVLADIGAVLGAHWPAGGPRWAEAEARLRVVGESHARAGRPLADLLVAQRIQRQVMVDHVRKVGTRLGCPPSEVLATSDALLCAFGTISTEIATAYRNAEPRQHAADRERAEFVRDLLWGSLDAARLTQVAIPYGIDVDREYLALRARPAPGHSVDELARILGLHQGQSTGGLGAVVNGDLVGFVAPLPQGTLCGVAGLGPARPLRLLHQSFRMATRALHTANRLSMTGICEFDRLGLLPAILSDQATGAALCGRYFGPLGEGEFAEEIVATLRAYLSNGMQAPRAAEVLCVHPNTVRYRIARFEELTGVTFRGNRTASFEVLWALEHRAAHGMRGVRVNRRTRSAS